LDVFEGFDFSFNYGIADIRDPTTLKHVLHSTSQQIVLHLAAQALVRYSYAQPVETYAVNVMGTVNLLEAVRTTPSVRALVNVTTFFRPSARSTIASWGALWSCSSCSS
jgi:GDP-D-mannose dehydratase